VSAESSVALTSTRPWFETDVLAEERNDQGRARLNAALLQHEPTLSRTRRVTLDIDSSESLVHGAREQSAAAPYYGGDYKPAAPSRPAHARKARGAVRGVSTYGAMT